MCYYVICVHRFAVSVYMHMYQYTCTCVYMLLCMHMFGVLCVCNANVFMCVHMFGVYICVLGGRLPGSPVSGGLLPA